MPQVHHVAEVQANQIDVGEVRRREEDRQHAHRRLHLDVGHERQVDQALDRPVTETGPDLRVLGVDLFARGMGRHLDAEEAQALQALSTPCGFSDFMTCRSILRR